MQSLEQALASSTVRALQVEVERSGVAAWRLRSLVGSVAARLPRRAA